VRTTNEIGKLKERDQREKCPGCSFDEFQMESDIKLHESLLKWATYKFSVFC
jgi:hypothetical protein